MACKDIFFPLAAFAVWTLASFFCHKLSKQATGLYAMVDEPFPFRVTPVVVTIIQVLCCYATTKVTSRKAGDLLLYVTATSHVMATLATNASLALTHASSAMAIKMLEPVTSAVLQRWLLRTPVEAEAVGGMAATVAGAVLYVGNPLRHADDTRAVAMAVISNLTLGVRNVAMKISHNSSSPGSDSRSYQLRPLASVVSFYFCASILIVGVRVVGGEELRSGLVYFLILSLASGTCHVIYSYVSTNVVLLCMSVVSHALANILKRVLVVLLLYASGQRTTSLWNWAGLALCMFGMLLYNRKKICSSWKSPASHASVLEPQQSEKDKMARQNDGWKSGHPETSTIRARQLLWLLVPVAIVCSLGMLPDKYFEYKGEGEGAGEDNDRAVVLVSRVLRSNPKGHERSKTDYALNLRFGYENWIDGKPLISGPTSFQPERKSRREIKEFLSREHLVNTPFDTDGLSPYLTTAKEVIDEGKRIHLNLFRDLLRGKKYAVLFELASFENKGDSAISLGELMFLEHLGVRLVTYVNVNRCSQSTVLQALKAVENLPKSEVVMLYHGGGNLIARSNVDRCRRYSLPMSSGYQQVMFSNSVWMKDNKYQFTKSRGLFCCNRNLTVLIRDRLSLRIVRKIFNGGTRFILAPDMALHIGYMGRYAAPYYDIIWQKRMDQENALIDQIPRFPSGVTTFVWDWKTMPSMPNDHSVRMAMNVVQNGFGILQQGKVLVTDRLHGHIMSMLLDIPHVLLDNADQKLSSFHNTWTRGVRNCRLADNAEDAARLALELLEEYKDKLPRRLSVVDNKEPIVV